MPKTILSRKIEVEYDSEVYVDKTVTHTFNLGDKSKICVFFSVDMVKHKSVATFEPYKEDGFADSIQLNRQCVLFETSCGGHLTLEFEKS